MSLLWGLPGAMISNSLTFHFSTLCMLVHSSNQQLFHELEHEGEKRGTKVPIEYTLCFEIPASLSEKKEKKEILFHLVVTIYPERFQWVTIYIADMIHITLSNMT